MTSPTTSADAIFWLGQLADGWRDKPGGNCPNLVAALDLAIATLTQHAEAGAVAWIFEREEYGEWITMLSRSREAGEGYGYRNLRPLFLHPAQPASQQANPTGDRVRSIETNVFTDDFGSLVVMLPSNDWVAGSMVRVTLVSLPTRAAALDQEKGR